MFPIYKTLNSATLTAQDEIHQVFVDAYYNKRKINYIIVGDSLRAGSTVTGLHSYYRTLLSNYNIDVYLSATAGLYTSVWRANTSPNTKARLSYTVANCIGTDGEDTIVEWNLGVNDHSVYGAASVQNELLLGIQDLLAQKSKVKIVLVVPTVSGTLQRGLDLLNSYTLLSAATGYHMVNGFDATESIFPYANASNAYYAETTHINEYGGRRICNFIMNNIIPQSIAWALTLPEYSGLEPETALINQAVVETGMYQSTGTALAGASWRRLDEITVTGRTLLKIQHQGTRKDIVWKNALNVHTLQNLPDLLPNVLYWLVQVPDDATTVKINIETVNGAAYDALADVPVVQNVVPLLPYVMPVEKINLGNNIRIKTQ